MKRLILRFAVAVMTFGFGFAIHHVLDSPKQKPRTVWKLEPVVACPPATPTSLPTPSPTPTHYLIFDYNVKKFDPRGTYFPLSPLPKAFAAFDLFEVSTDEYQGKVWGSGLVQTRANDMYDFQNANFLLVTDKRLIFYSAPRFAEQFEYRFEGEFLGNPGRLIDTGKPAVRGTLSKMKDGRKIAEVVVSFEVQYLGC